ncbi:hypothetical protein D3C81_2140940 [compost metagenome]
MPYRWRLHPIGINHLCIPEQGGAARILALQNDLTGLLVGRSDVDLAVAADPPWRTADIGSDQLDGIARVPLERYIHRLGSAG